MPHGRRIHNSGTGVTNTWFLNDGDDEVVEYNSNKDVVAIYVPGPAIDEPIAMVTPNGNGTYNRKYFHANHQGSVIAMSDDAGARVEGPFLYGPYGSCFQLTTPCAQLASSVPYKFTSRRLDPETELYYYRARMYWGAGGRFLQTDPVGYTADLNLYTYVGNDPTDELDPTGEAVGLAEVCPEDPTCKGTGTGQRETVVVTGQRQHRKPKPQPGMSHAQLILAGAMAAGRAVRPIPVIGPGAAAIVAIGGLALAGIISLTEQHDEQSDGNVDIDDPDSVRGADPEEVAQAAKDKGYTEVRLQTARIRFAL